MLCDICKKNVATVHLTQMVEGKTKKVDLCEACSKERGWMIPPGFPWQTCYWVWAAAQGIAQSSSEGELRCSQCGFTQADFKKAGRLGCAECYDAFAEGLEGLLKTMHKGTKHVGKVPQSLKRSQDLSDRLKTLQKKLEKAVAEEDFETAVQLRDEINQIRAESQN